MDARPADARPTTADTDSLTGMLSRSGFRSLMQACMQSYGVIHIDLDQFTQVNVLFGEEVADKLLHCIASRIEEYVGVVGQCARFGSDEFAVLLPGVATDDDLEMCCLELIAHLQQSLSIDNVSLYPQFAVGAAYFMPGSTRLPADAGEVLQHAYIALQQARYQDYPRYSVFNAVQRHVWENRAYLELQLLEAIHKGDLSVAYQPIVDAVTGDIEGFEALARWILPDGRSSSPTQFIPIAEKNGVIIALGKQIFSAAMRDFAEISLQAKTPLKLHINVSARQLADPGLCDELICLLEAYAIKPSQLVIELTESTVAQHFDRLVMVIQNIKAAGIGIALDDFGTGFSSLSYIASLTLDVIKIDRSFIVNANENEETLCIMRAIVAMARSLGMKTVAEGVELPAHVALIKRECCDFLQGYFAGKPMTAAQCQQLLRERSSLPMIRDIMPGNPSAHRGAGMDQCPMSCRNRRLAAST